MAQAHAAACGQIVSHQLALLNDGNKTAVIGQHVNIVQRRNDEGDFEFSRQIGFAVERIDKMGVFLGQFQFHAFDPNLVVGRGFGQERVGNQFGVALDFVHQQAGGGRRGGHDVAVDVAAGGDGGGHGVVESAH